MFGCTFREQEIYIKNIKFGPTKIGGRGHRPPTLNPRQVLAWTLLFFSFYWWHWCQVGGRQDARCGAT